MKIKQPSILTNFITISGFLAVVLAVPALNRYSIAELETKQVKADSTMILQDNAIKALNFNGTANNLYLVARDSAGFQQSRIQLQRLLQQQAQQSQENGK